MTSKKTKTDAELLEDVQSLKQYAIIQETIITGLVEMGLVHAHEIPRIANVLTPRISEALDQWQRQDPPTE